jgi:hypothetical protein
MATGTVEPINDDISYSAIFRSGWTVFKTNFFLLLSITLTIFIPTSILRYFIFNAEFLKEIGLMRSSLQGSILSIATNEIGFVPAVMAIAVIVDGEITGSHIGYKNALMKAFTQWPKAIVVQLLLNLVLLGGCFACVIPAVFYWIAYGFFAQAVALRDQGGLKALYYSKSIVDGIWWEVFFFAVFLFLLGLPLSIAAIVLISVLKLEGFARSAVFYPVFALTTPFFETITTVLFLELENRRRPQVVEEREGPETAQND